VWGNRVEHQVAARHRLPLLIWLGVSRVASCRLGHAGATSPTRGVVRAAAGALGWWHRRLAASTTLCIMQQLFFWMSMLQPSHSNVSSCYRCCNNCFSCFICYFSCCDVCISMFPETPVRCSSAFSNWFMLHATWSHVRVGNL
jgi:hypothetical protein